MTSIWFPNNKYPPNTKNYLPCFVLGGGGFSIRRKGLYVFHKNLRDLKSPGNCAAQGYSKCSLKRSSPTNSSALAASDLLTRCAWRSNWAKASAACCGVRGTSGAQKPSRARRMGHGIGILDSCRRLARRQQPQSVGSWAIKSSNRSSKWRYLGVAELLAWHVGSTSFRFELMSVSLSDSD